MISLGLTEFREVDGMRMRPIGLYMFFCEEEYIADLASMYIGGTTGCSVTEELCTRFEQVVQIPLAFVSCRLAKTVIEMKKKGNANSLRTVVFIDKPTTQLLEDFKSFGVTVKFWDELINLGLSLNIPLPKSQLNTIVCLTGTSGTTGNPKVIIYLTL